MAREVTVASIRRPGGRNWKIDEGWQRAIVAGTAARHLRMRQREGSFPTDPRDYVQVVNGREGKPLHKVHMHGNLSKVVIFQRYGGAQDWVKAGLELIWQLTRRQVFARKSRSDMKSGVPFRQRHHAGSFIMLRDGRRVAGPGLNFYQQARAYIQSYGPAMGPGDILSIVNIQPYARRIEVGWSMQAPRGVLRQLAVSRAVKTTALYRKFEYRPLPAAAGSEIVSQGAVTTYAERRKGKRNRWEYSGRVMRKHRVYPVLHFGPPTGGVAARTPERNRKWSGRADVRETVATRGELRGLSRRQSKKQRIRSSGVRVTRTFQRSRGAIFNGRIEVVSR